MRKYVKLDPVKNYNFFPVIILLFTIGLSPFVSGFNGLTRDPVVGITQDSQTTILVRANEIGNVQIEFYEIMPDSQLTLTDWGRLSHSKDLTVNLTLKEIKYNANYNYRIIFEDGNKSNWYSFSTFPKQSQKGQFSFIFSACFRDKYLPHPIFQNVLQVKPTFVALMGDQMYADYDGDINSGPSTSVLPALRSKYSRNFDEHFQALSSRVPIVAIWDDHDYGQDNSDSTYLYKEEVKRVFKENYPAYPFQDEDGGIYYQFKIADVDVFALDTRWYRSPMQDIDVEGKTMLGEKQLSWLLDGLIQSVSPFKIILSSVSFNDYGGDTSFDRSGYDSWMGYKFERDKILSFIKDNQISGVVVFSGDQHYPSAHILNWEAPINSIAETDTSITFSLSDLGTAVFDFSASPFHYTRATGHKLIPGNQNNPIYSHEIFRATWGGEFSDAEPTSVYGLAEIETTNSIKKLSVSFYEMNTKNGQMELLYKISVERDQSTAIKDEPVKFPTSVLLARNYPNPFNGQTNIVYSIPEKSKTELSIYDIRGAKMITLVNGLKEKGEHKIIWNGANSLGIKLPSGIYFYRIKIIGDKSGSHFSSIVKKMVYLK